MDDLPNPAASGASGAQERGPTTVDFGNELVPLNDSNRLTSAVEGVLAAHPSGIGTPITGQLILGMMQQIGNENVRLRIDLSQRDQQLTRCTEQLGAANTKIAELNVKVETARGLHLFREIAIFSGTVVLAIAVTLLQNKSYPIGSALGLVGLLLLLSAFVAPRFAGGKS